MVTIIKMLSVAEPIPRSRKTASWVKWVGRAQKCLPHTAMFDLFKRHSFFSPGSWCLTKRPRSASPATTVPRKCGDCEAADNCVRKHTLPLVASSTRCSIVGVVSVVGVCQLCQSMNATSIMPTPGHSSPQTRLHRRGKAKCCAGKITPFGTIEKCVRHVLGHRPAFIYVFFFCQHVRSGRRSFTPTGQ